MPYEASHKLGFHIPPEKDTQFLESDKHTSMECKKPKQTNFNCWLEIAYIKSPHQLLQDHAGCNFKKWAQGGRISAMLEKRAHFLFSTKTQTSKLLKRIPLLLSEDILYMSFTGTGHNSYKQLCHIIHVTE